LTINCHCEKVGEKCENTIGNKNGGVKTYADVEGIN
jgi:hypothetical protein